jgi:8-oxo-dGTP diphosphatase
MTSQAGRAIHVMAGVLRDSAGRVLLAQRPAGDALAGLWEFPGGKCEPGEDALAALARELDEELGIHVEDAEPLIQVPWLDPRKALLLDAWCVTRWHGTPVGREGQPLRWAELDDLHAIEMPPADRPVTTALRMARCMLVTPEPDADAGAFLARIERALDGGVRLLQLRARHASPAVVHELATALQRLARPHGARVLLNGHPALAIELGLDGVHLPASALTPKRPVPADMLCGASCHDARELSAALAAGVDYVVLGPVAETASHPGAPSLGWQAAAALIEGYPLPVFLIGGLGPGDLAAARALGAYGIAAIRAYLA